MQGWASIRGGRWAAVRDVQRDPWAGAWDVRYVHFFHNQGWQELESRRTTSENTGPESVQPQHQYVWSRRYIDAPVLRDKNTDADGLCDDERVYYLGDANFNVTTLVSTAGDAVERCVYSPYGVLTIYDATWANIRSASSYANVYTYSGRQLDTETGLYCYRARCLHAQVGRFTSRDPIGYEASSNTMQYSDGNPVVGIDPSGKACQVFYNCNLITSEAIGKFIKTCIYACSENDKKRIPRPGIGITVDRKDLTIPVYFTLRKPVARYICRCAKKLEDYSKLWDEGFGGICDCDREECIQQTKNTATKGRLACNALPPGLKQTCKQGWNAWEAGMLALCEKCTGKKEE